MSETCKKIAHLFSRAHSSTCSSIALDRADGSKRHPLSKERRKKNKKKLKNKKGVLGIVVEKGKMQAIMTQCNVPLRCIIQQVDHFHSQGYSIGFDGAYKRFIRSL
ncbi:hypothetical protein CEXT_192771 [Caerostris extrusa]|uniref:Uncharacterized protein n=1 Tax=Caerostris extrusa TaxID=172846 RepID=A0AAV4XX66_CAEEX|nr:hypothetical protein CEXT_192771 [Caerostris extrusa]